MAKANPTEVQNFIGGMDYPCSRQDLVNHARESGAGEKVLSTLDNLPRESFNSPAEVTEAMRDMR